MNQVLYSTLNLQEVPTGTDLKKVNYTQEVQVNLIQEAEEEGEQEG